jgi:hypothetical protein
VQAVAHPSAFGAQRRNAAGGAADAITFGGRG